MTTPTQTTAGFGSRPSDFVMFRTKEGALNTRVSVDPDGTIRCADRGHATTFSCEVETVDSIDKFAQLLTKQQDDPQAAHVRGSLPLGANPSCFKWRPSRRKWFEEDPRRFELVDPPRDFVLFGIKDVPAADNWHQDPEAAALDLIHSRFPAEFHDCSFVAVVTEGAGIKPGLHLHLGFLLGQPVEGDELEEIMADAPIDPLMLRPESLICTAAPSFIGLSDPIRQRVVVHQGERERVPLVVLWWGQGPSQLEPRQPEADPGSQPDAYSLDEMDFYISRFEFYDDFGKDRVFSSMLAGMDPASFEKDNSANYINFLAAYMAAHAPSAKAIIEAQCLKWERQKILQD